MPDAVHRIQLVRFGIFEADRETGELRRNGRKIRLAEQPFQVLAILLERPGRIVTREELQKRLWPDTVVEVEHSLNTAINKIREALGDSAENPRFVETIPRRGYRFIAPVVESLHDGAAACEPASTAAAAVLEDSKGADSKAGIEQRTGKRRWLLAGGVATVGIAIALSGWILGSRLPPPRVTDYAQLTNDGRPRMIGGTDGIRLFVNAFEPDEFAELSTSDGRSSPFSVAFPPDAQYCASGVSEPPAIRDVSPDGLRLIVLCVVQLHEKQVWIVGAVGRPARFLTNAQDAAWSPDGKSIVYSTVDGAIYRIPSEGGESRLVVPAIAPHGESMIVRDLAWSPKGSSIRFTAQRAIWEASVDGGSPHRVLSPEKWKLPSCCGRWTRDGDFFVFIYGDSRFHEYLNERAAQLWALDERRGWFGRRNPEPIQLIAGPTQWADPIPSVDGKHIFARGVTIRGQVLRYDARVKQLQPYLGGISALELAFSPDGKYVAYVTFPEGVLWRANRDGSDVVQLTQPSESAAVPFWSPDDSRIVYEATLPSGQGAVMVISSHGGSPTPLLSEPKSGYNDANWSPDGKRLVYGVLPDIEGRSWNVNDVKLRIYDIERHQISIIPDSERTFSPRWSPDGRYIAASAIESSELHLYDLKEKKWVRIARSQAAYPAWSRDSRFIYAYCGDRFGICRTPVSGGPVELVLDLKNVRQTGWWGFWFGLDPDDAPLILGDAGGYEIYSLTFEH